MQRSLWMEYNKKRAKMMKKQIHHTTAISKKSQVKITTALGLLGLLNTAACLPAWADLLDTCSQDLDRTSQDGDFLVADMFDMQHAQDAPMGGIAWFETQKRGFYAELLDQNGRAIDTVTLEKIARTNTIEQLSDPQRPLVGLRIPNQSDGLQNTPIALKTGDRLRVRLCVTQEEIQENLNKCTENYIITLIDDAQEPIDWNTYQNIITEGNTWGHCEMPDLPRHFVGLLPQSSQREDSAQIAKPNRFLLAIRLLSNDTNTDLPLLWLAPPDIEKPMYFSTFGILNANLPASLQQEETANPVSLENIENIENITDNAQDMRIELVMIDADYPENEMVSEIRVDRRWFPRFFD